MFIKECVRGKGCELQLILAGGSTLIIPNGGEIPFNRIFQNNTKVKWFDEGCGNRCCDEDFFIKFRENDTRAKTKLKGRYVVEGYVDIAAAPTNAISVTDNEGQDDLNSLANDTSVFGSLFIDEKSGTISLKNVSGAAITLTPSVTNPQIPVAKMIITYDGK